MADESSVGAGSQFGAGGDDLSLNVREGAPSVPRVVDAGVVRRDVSVASQGATVLGMNSNFRTTPRNIAELKDGEVLARRADRGKKGSKTYLAIHKSATTPLKDKLLGARFLNATSESGERMNKNKSIQEDVTSNLRALEPILNQLKQHDCDHVFQVPSEKFYSEFGRTFQARWNMDDPDYEAVDISKHWAKLPLAHVKLWQQDFNLFAFDEDLTSSNWVQELIEVMLDSEVRKQVKEKYDPLPQREKGGIVYFKIAMEIIFKMSSLTVAALREYFIAFGRNGLNKVQGENARTAGTMLIAVATRLADHGSLESEAIQHVADGFSRCSVKKFRDIFTARSSQLTFLDALEGFGSMSSSEVLKEVEDMVYPAMTIFDNLNLSGAWNVPGPSLNANGVPICDNCGATGHIAPECTLPRDEERCKQACEARLKASKEAGREGGRGGGRGRGDNESGRRGQWSKSSNTASVASGVDCIDGEWMMHCKDCGWNKNHTTKYCGESKRTGDGYFVPETHPFWGISKTTFPGTGAGSGSPTDTDTDSSSSVAGRLSAFIDARMPHTENSDVAVLLAELKNCLQGN